MVIHLCGRKTNTNNLKKSCGKYILDAHFRIDILTYSLDFHKGTHWVVIFRSGMVLLEYLTLVMAYFILGTLKVSCIWFVPILQIQINSIPNDNIETQMNLSLQRPL